MENKVGTENKVGMENNVGMEDKVGTGKMTAGIAMALGILIVSNVAAQQAATVLGMLPIPFLDAAAQGIIYVLFAYYLIKLLITEFFKGSLCDYNIPRFGLDLKWLLAAFLLPLAVTGIYLCLPGQFVGSDMAMWETIETVIEAVLFYGIGAGIVEELVFRGVILHLLDARFGREIAIFAPSVLFGLLHIIGGGLGIFDAVLVLIAGTVVGVMFSLIALEGKSIWNSAAVHAVWNTIMIGGILGIGEKASPYQICSYVLSSRHFAVTGGEFGVESSVIAVIGYFILCGVAYAGIRRKTETQN